MSSERFRDLIEKKGENPLLLFSLGQALIDEEQFEEATIPLQKCCDGNEDWLMARLLLGKAYVALNHPEQARHFLNRARELSIQQEHVEPLVEIERMENELLGN